MIYLFSSSFTSMWEFNMAEPIILNEFGAILIPRDNSRTDWCKDYLGNHEGCGDHNDGSMFVSRESSTHNVIVCKGCFMRIVVTANVVPLVVSEEVFEQLRQWCARNIRKQQQREREFQYLWSNCSSEKKSC